MDTLNLLVCFPHELWTRKMSPVRRHAVWALERRPDVNVTISGQGWPDWSAQASASDNRRAVMPDAHAVLWYKPLGARDVPALVQPKSIGVLAVETYNECWWPDNQAAREVIENGTNLVVCHHANDMPRMALARKSGCTVVHIPHCAEPTMFQAAARPWAERDIDVLLTGVTGETYYPLRARWQRLVDAGKLPGKVHCHRHPGYRQRGVRECEAAVREYAALLGRAKVHLVCASKFRYPLAKYVEGAMAGCLTVGDMPEQAPPGYEKIVWSVNPSDSDAELVRAVAQATAGNSLGAFGLAAQAVALERYNMDAYAAAFLAAVRAAI